MPEKLEEQRSAAESSGGFLEAVTKADAVHIQGGFGVKASRMQGDVCPSVQDLSLGRCLIRERC
jgi:hypothetical protein